MGGRSAKAEEGRLIGQWSLEKSDMGQDAVEMLRGG